MAPAHHANVRNQRAVVLNPDAMRSSRVRKCAVVIRARQLTATSCMSSTNRPDPQDQSVSICEPLQPSPPNSCYVWQASASHPKLTSRGHRKCPDGVKSVSNVGGCPSPVRWPQPRQNAGMRKRWHYWARVPMKRSPRNSNCRSPASRANAVNSESPPSGTKLRLRYGSGRAQNVLGLTVGPFFLAGM
jgi:hypothetical protein